MSDCFISYRRTPSSAVATTIQAKLESMYGFDVYLDTTRTDGSRVSFPERLMKAIEDAPVFVCLLGERDGQHTLESEWVLKEIEKAYELGKFCIPVFQESYRPLEDISSAVEYLLNFDGVHYFDVKNVMVDDSVRQIADLTRPHRIKQRSVPLVSVGILLTIAVLAIIAFVLLSGEDEPNDAGITPSVDIVETQAIVDDDNDTPIDTGGQPEIVITSPEDGDEIIVNEVVLVRVTATDTVGVTQVRLDVDGLDQIISRTVSSTESGGQTQGNFVLDFTPRSTGDIVVTVRAFRDNVGSEPAEIALVVRP